MLAVLFTFTLGACSDNDDDFNPSDFAGRDAALVGKWQRARVSDGWSDVETFIFKADGTYEETDVETNRSTTDTDWERGTWSTNATKNQVLLKVTASSDPSDVGERDVENYKVKDGVLTLDRDTYTLVTE